ncbi:hypothetical protein [Aeromonas phage 14AhydR10PP]|nr:hypothetical protein [Aeromonas phage 14AhydR10PP]
MKDRDGNETGQPNTSSIRPDAASLEQGVDPLTTEDYGSAGLLARLQALCLMPDVRVTHAVKVQGDGRLVVEFQAVSKEAPMIGLPPSMAFEPTL